jgi:HD-like signal output (HDOD) protein
MGLNTLFLSFVLAGNFNMKKASVPKLDLKKILSAAQLPGLPQSAVRLLDLSKDPNNGPAEYASPIEVDPGLSGQVLKLVNSSYFGFAREISSVRMAVNLVGITTIKNFTLWNAVWSLMTNPRYGPFELKSLWQDSLRRALFARALANLLNKEEAEDVFAAALLQDMAIPILANESPHFYMNLLQSRKQGRMRLSSLENQLFGWQHAQAAGMMVLHWNLPEKIANLIENHIAIDEFVNKPESAPDMVAIGMSALLPTIVDPVWTECQQFESYYEKILPGNIPTIVELLSNIDDDFSQFAPLLKIAKPTKTLVESYNEVTVSQG